MTIINERLNEIRNEMATIGSLCEEQVDRIIHSNSYQKTFLDRLTDRSVSPREIAAEILFSWSQQIMLRSGMAYQICLRHGSEIIDGVFYEKPAR